MTNYFELYQVPQSFHPDPAAVKKKYYELSRQYHPDRHAHADDATRNETLRMAALNNDAYKTLGNADKLMAYILKLNGLLEEEEKYNLPPAFLMEMMDLNELVSDYEMAPQDQSIKEQAENMLHEQLTAWQQSVAPLTQHYNAETDNKAVLLQVKDHYFRKKYLLRIQERINTFASR